MQIKHLTNREITSGQVHDCLNVIATTSSWMTKTSNTPDADFLPAEARIAMELSLIKACDRLDKILGDDARWEVSTIDAQRFADELAISEVAVGQQAVIAHQQGIEQAAGRIRRNEAIDAEATPASPKPKTPATNKRKSK